MGYTMATPRDTAAAVAPDRRCVDNIVRTRYAWYLVNNKTGCLVRVRPKAPAFLIVELLRYRIAT